MTMLSTRHPIAPLAELVRDMSPDAQALAVPAIQHALNQARHYAERMDEARDLELQFKALEHTHEPFQAPDNGSCRRCSIEDEYLIVLGSADRAKAMLATGRLS